MLTTFGCIVRCGFNCSVTCIGRHTDADQQTRIGLFDLRAELTTLRDFGLPNQPQLSVNERRRSRPTHSPLA